MSEQQDARLAQLRQAFDQSFAVPPPGNEAALERLIGLQAGSGRFAARIGDLSGIHALPAIRPLPGGAPALMGLAGIQGRVVAVYDLATLLGQPDNRKGVRWLTLLRCDPSIGLAFDRVEGYHGVSPDAFLPATADQGGIAVTAFIQTDETILGVLSIEAIVAALVAVTPT